MSKFKIGTAIKIKSKFNFKIKNYKYINYYIILNIKQFVILTFLKA